MRKESYEQIYLFHAGGKGPCPEYRPGVIATGPGRVSYSLRREYHTPNDPGITVRGNKWFDHSARVGGYAVSFVQRYYRLSYQEAVLLLLGSKDGKRYEQAQPATTELKPFALTGPYDNMRCVYAYLMRQRCIDREVITSFVREKLLYPTEKKREYGAF